LELLNNIINDYLIPIAGEAHFGLFLLVWFSAIWPLALPEEAFTLLGGALVAYGKLQWAPATLAIIGGITATNVTQYGLGRGGLKLLSGTRFGKRIIHSRSFRRANQAMTEKGIWAIVGCRFFFGTRAPTYIATGFFRYRFWKFFSVDSTVVLIHGIPFMIVGYLFAEQIDSLIEFMEELGVWSLVFLGAALLAFFGFKRWRSKRLDKKETGPLCPSTQD
jgi:membrane protein DedA with SNARE-associated domain